MILFIWFQVQGLSDTLKLYQAKFAKGMRILWELAIAFSPRLSEEAEKRINEDIQEELAVRGGRIYTEIIRVWDIVFQHQKVMDAIASFKNFLDTQEKKKV